MSGQTVLLPGATPGQTRRCCLHCKAKHQHSMHSTPCSAWPAGHNRLQHVSECVQQGGAYPDAHNLVLHASCNTVVLHSMYVPCTPHTPYTTCPHRLNAPAIDNQNAPIHFTLSSIFWRPKNTTATPTRGQGTNQDDTGVDSATKDLFRHQLPGCTSVLELYKRHMQGKQLINNSIALLLASLPAGIPAQRLPDALPFHQLPRNRCRPNRLTGSSSSFLDSACFSTSHSDTCRQHSTARVPAHGTAGTA